MKRIENVKTNQPGKIKVCDARRGDDEGLTPGTSGRSKLRN